MLLLTLLLFLTAIPDLSLGKSGISLELQKEIVDKHNEMRRNVQPTASNMLKMTWNEKLSDGSKRWNDECQTKTIPPEERMLDGVMCGQNTFQATLPASWPKILDYWKSKSRLFKYGVGPLDPQKPIYRYTQAIWYRSHQIGCSVSQCPAYRQKYLYSCLYCPAGNIFSRKTKPYKEGPPCGDCPDHCENKLCTNPCENRDQFLNCAELKKQVGCEKANSTGKCQATCDCQNKIN
uniref:serotriflin-like n=1 Tax=Euleptes europaea TaxID=460621 RepID=UPI0025418018|nr:serotriflin-like [Euleptes europaea]